MSIQADSAGDLSGFFDIPPGIPAGIKSVQFLGEGGSFGDASYTGSGTITLEQRRRVTEIITQRFDPLAQTFTLPESEHIAACTLQFVEKGTKEVRVQIRTMQSGVPTQTVLSEGFITAADINLNGLKTQINFDPVFIEKNQEYALVLLSDDAEHSVAIAETNKYSQNTNGWVTAQPYQIGVLLSSSNASTWTAHQNKDLAFELLACRFKKTSTEILVGVFTLTDVTDILIFADIERTDANTDIEWLIRRSDKEDIRIQTRQSLALPEAITGEIKLIAKLTGTQNRSPILYTGVQIIVGTLQEEAEYISRAINLSTKSDSTIRLKRKAGGQSNVHVYYQKDNKDWAVATFKHSEAVGDGWEERVYSDAIGSTQTRVKLRLTGDTKNRPLAQDLRMVTIDAV